MTAATFAWFCPSYVTDSNLSNGVIVPEDIIRTAVVAEKAGFDAILTAADSHSYDPWTLSAYMLQATKSIRSIIALRTGFVEPVYAARMLTSLEHLSRGRTDINIVTGGSTAELAKEGTFLEHGARYQRTGEFMDIFMNLIESGGPVNHEGLYYTVRNATLFPRGYGERKPTVYTAGASIEAKQVAAKHGAVYLIWAEPRQAVLHHMEQYSKLVNDPCKRFGIRVNVLLRNSRKEALAALKQYDSKAAVYRNILAPVINRLSDSVGQRTMAALKSEKFYDECFYAGATGMRTGSVPFLLGTPDEVSYALKRYMDMGISHFILNSIDPIRECERIGNELLLRYKER